MQVIAVRHGQSTFNVLGLCNDDPATGVDLTPIGVAQANKAAQKLLGQTIDGIYCSPLRRARRTAQIIAETIGVPVVEESRLSDIRSGCDGRPVCDYLAAIAHDPVYARVGDGESLADYAERIGDFLRELPAFGQHCVLLVAHEETLRVVQALCAGEDLAAVAGRSFDNCQPYFFELGSGNR